MKNINYMHLANQVQTMVQSQQQGNTDKAIKIASELKQNNIRKLK